jgi:hypothetical protein
MVLRKADKKTELGMGPHNPVSPVVLEKMGKLAEEMMKAGVLLGGDGLRESAKGARLKFSGGDPEVIDGPFTETKELVAGFFLLQVKSLDEAIAWMKRWPREDVNGELELEIRQLVEASDFGEELTPKAREAEEKMRAELAKKS